MSRQKKLLLPRVNFILSTASLLSSVKPIDHLNIFGLGRNYLMSQSILR